MGISFEIRERKTQGGRLEPQSPPGQRDPNERA